MFNAKRGKPRPLFQGAGFQILCTTVCGVLFLANANASKALVELCHLAPGIKDTLYAGPCWMGLRVHVQTQRITRLAVARAGGEFGAVCHDDVDFVVVWVNAGFHDGSFPFKQGCPDTDRAMRGSGYTDVCGCDQQLLRRILPSNGNIIGTGEGYFCCIRGLSRTDREKARLFFALYLEKSLTS